VNSVSRILLVEDDPVDTQLALELLREGLPDCLVTHVNTVDGAARVLATEHVDAILLDLRLPDGTGCDVLSRVRAVSDAPIVVLTSVVDDQLSIELVKAGADDYLIKGRLGPESLTRVLRFAVHRHARAAGGAAQASQLPIVALLGGHPLLLGGLASALLSSGTYGVLGPFPTFGALEAARDGRLDAAVIDVTELLDKPSLPLAQLRLRLPGTKILLLADGPGQWLQAVLDDNHADGVIDDTSSAAHVVEALGRLLDEQVVLPSGWRTQREREVASDPLAVLSDRQRQVLTLVASGSSNDEIAQQLYISVNTVKFHVRSTYRELGIHSRLQAAQMLVARPD
jgi:DNA-binding NarL/FixJ family response regulator